MKIEHISLQPHPLETWRKALDALIACAPGTGPEIAAYLFHAARRANSEFRPTRVTDLQRRLVNKLMVTVELQEPPKASEQPEPAEFNEAGFLLDSPAIGEPRPRGQVRHITSGAFHGSRDPLASPESVSPATASSTAGDQASQPSPCSPPNAATHVTSRSSGLPVSQSDQT